MSDLASDHDAAIELVIGEYRRLQKHNPEHPLLKYLSEVSDDGIRYSPATKVRQEFINKFAPDKRTPTAVMLASYYIELRETVDKIEGINRTPPPPRQPDFRDDNPWQRQTDNHVTTLEADDEDIPF